MRDLPDHAAAVRAALTDPRALCDALGLIAGPRSVRRQAHGVTVRCPWHNENEPSCSVTLGSDGTIRVFCFACSAGGDALSLIAPTHSLDVKSDFPAVLAEGARLAGIELPAHGTRAAPLPRPAPRPGPTEPERLSDDAFDAIACALADACALEREPDVRAYCERRGVFGEVRDEWFALPADPSEQHALERDMIHRFGIRAWCLSGLANERGGLLWSDHRLCIPWRDGGIDGVVTTLQRRIIRAPREKREPRYVFPSGRSRASCPYGTDVAVEVTGPETEVCIVEGAMDTVAHRLLCRRNRVDRVVFGLPGLGGWRTEWAGLARGRVVVVAFDPDPAGNAAAAAVARDLRAAGARRVDRSVPVGGHDWAELAEEAKRT